MNQKRKCSQCGSEKTYVNKRGSEEWTVIDKENNVYICSNCRLKKYKKENPELYKRSRNKSIAKKKDYYKNYYKNYFQIRMIKLKNNPKEHELFKKRCTENSKRYSKNHPQKIHVNNCKNIKFLGKSVRLKTNPRTGVCSNCGKNVRKGEIPSTSMHHKRYERINPTRYTVELCPSCHRKEHLNIDNTSFL